jgi:hypothetical protein
MLQADTSDIDKLERDLKALRRTAIPYAERGAINGAAFGTQKTARETIDDKMVLRNAWTQRTVMVDRATGKRPARVGSTQDYMETQEFGGRERIGHIPTSASAGMSEGSKPRTRLPRKPNRMANIRLRKRRGKVQNRRQRTAVAIAAAKRKGDKYVFLDTGRTRGIFRLMGGKRRTRLRMMHDMSRKSVQVPRTPWLRPSLPSRQDWQRYHAEALGFQIQRLKLFKRA